MSVDQAIPELGNIYPPERLLTKPAQFIPYESDALTAYRVHPQAVVIAESQDEVVETVRLCTKYHLPFVARGSGTSLSGGSLPVKDGIVIALNRLNRILRIDPEQRIAVVEPGVANLEVSKAASSYGLYYAPDPSSQPICTIGGNLAFNSGGAHCLKYGMTSNHILGIKAVLPDGEIVHLGGDSLESVGPDLVGLYTGSEGLFGIALEITLRLLPKAEAYHTVLASYESLEAAGDVVSQVIAAGLLPAAMEIMDRLAIEAAEVAVDANYPPDAAVVLIVEMDGEANQAQGEFSRLMDVIEHSGAQEIRIAAGDADRQMIWKGRKSAFSAVGRLSPDYLVQDGVVPRGKLGAALAEIDQLSSAYNLRVANVFHAGDGNLHPLILYNGRESDELERAEELAGKILDMCIRYGGSITGEHGVGVEKRDYLPLMFAPRDIETFRDIHNAIDPGDISNPGKLFPEDEKSSGRNGHRERPWEKEKAIQELRSQILNADHVLPVGGSTKPALSTPEDGCAVLDLSRISGMIEYEPEEFTFTALAGTPISQVEAILQENGQYLPFDPPLVERGATLGGTVAAGLSGAGRYRFGGVRDFLLGVRYLNAKGQIVHGGGKVVKNAAGFDLPKLMVGSLGSLGVLVELTFKVLPQPEMRTTLRLEYPDLAATLNAQTKLFTSPLNIEAVDIETMDDSVVLWVRLAGLEEGMPAGVSRFQELMGGGEELKSEAEAQFWRNTREMTWVPEGWQLVKIPLTPRHIHTLDKALVSSYDAQSIKRRYSCGGQQAWVALNAPLPALNNILSERELSGLVLYGPSGLRTLGVLPGSTFRKRIKVALDPDGRFVEL